MSKKVTRHPCLNCEQADMKFATQTATARLYGLSESVPDVTGWHCPHCGEVEFIDKDSAARFDAALQKLDARNRQSLTRVRKKLRLTQADAAKLTGGGHNAFSRYERGEAKPMAAVVNLFRLLDKHPELLKELRLG
ncbi:type II toxin-antitoxin system MqsA family antitoxin [Solimonas terrae]|uniref:Type II toxin-antitoxin system MqsA family antitoxin n=1 Tax=Solimonas terrae TaxID=1396819 RepID=A0A6M2BXY7_9GAMM|nr:type II toxin-antitoxin system MqsA family antitoxin [Solimonas terrae]NGY06983.1 type II toxin-antitoxin system MqsA family antitoxin [Solimonas terrae]